MTDRHAGPRRLIYVHGIKPKPPPAVHAAVLRECLLTGVQRAAPAVAAEMAADPAWLDLVAWSHEFYPGYRDLAPDQAGIAGLRADAQPGREQIAPVFGPRHRLATLVHGIGDRYPFLIRWLATAATRESLAEAMRYFADRDGESQRIRARLRRSLADAFAVGARVLLMTHSFGSVIAFDVLWELSRQPGGAGGRIERFVTLGSPLGARYIRTRLHGAAEQGAARYPDCIDAWWNLAALGDLASLGRRLGEHFGAMRDLGLVAAIHDRTDLVNPFRGAEGLNVHRCYGYHVHRATGGVVAGWWRGATAVSATGA
jgi:hypothetical protein